jgi:hypothetical protein
LPRAVEVALEPRDAVDEELAVQVIELVLERDGEEPVGLDRDLLLLRRPRLEEDALGPLLAVKSGTDRQPPRT